MKKVLLSIVLLALGLNLSLAQSPQFIKEMLDEVQQKFDAKKVLQNAETLIDPFKICMESFSWDTLNNEFIYSGESTFTYEKSAGLNTFTIDAITIGDDGSENKIRIIFYSSLEFTGAETDFIGDSSLIFFVDGDNYLLVSRTIYQHENGKLLLQEEYFDFSIFGLPLGMTKSSETRYYYDANDFLVHEASDNFDFASFSLVISDSTHYVNNDIGFAVDEYNYNVDFITGSLAPYDRSTYTYINQFFVEEEVIYDPAPDDAWMKVRKSTNTYDNQNRLTETIYEQTADDGVNWALDAKTINVYEEDLPFYFPTRSLDQEYSSGEWVNVSMDVAENCTTAGVDGIALLDFEAWMRDGIIFLNADEHFDGDVQLSVYDINGRTLYQAFYTAFPERLSVQGLSSGIYIISAISNKAYGVKKIIK